VRRHYLRWFKKKSVPVLECKRGFKDDGNDDEEKNSSEEEDTSDDCKDGGGDGGILNESSKKKYFVKIWLSWICKNSCRVISFKVFKEEGANNWVVSKKKSNSKKDQKVEKQKCENNVIATVANAPVITTCSQLKRKMKNTETSNLQSAEAPSTAAKLNLLLPPLQIPML